ncbi:hypothetical protein LJE71_12820 [Xanthobacter autotrophicus]|uniref:hypothetical protein n=1 Tax=Xanthobacter autotrophicus TaxID=280 RepID=UPI001E39773A|nr:hypothetical protein [Xanthobacter autotrophicus]UDQ87203.1 hypothetical protein LJE71_12820 [Xanthobacter autotrophicus]
MANVYHKTIHFTIFANSCFYQLSESPKTLFYIQTIRDLFSIFASNGWNNMGDLKTVSLITPVETAPLSEVTFMTAKMRLALAMGAAM